MKLVMTLMVRDEADIIAANLDYHLAQGVDFVLIVDHGSQDGTSELLREYERSGVAAVTRDDRDGYHQSDHVTRMVQIALDQHQADWVMNNDADEFWWPLAGDLRDVFASVPPRYGQIEVQRRNFRPRPDGEGPFYSRLIHREVLSRDRHGDPLGRKVAHRPVAGVVVATGGHSISGAELVPVPVADALEIFHFPMRSYEQFERKVVQTGLALEQLHDRPPMVGWEQLELLQLHRAGALREHYDAMVHDAGLDHELQAGTLVIDRRLSRFMDGPARDRGQDRPDSQGARALLAATMGAVVSDEDGRAQLTDLVSRHELLAEQAADLQRAVTVGRAGEAQLQQRLAALHGQLEALHGQLEALHGQLEETSQELAGTRHALALLRSSRLMRSTSWARRLYYRAAGKS